MKSNILFFNTKLCSGCLLCEMTCSLIQKGECSRDASFIKVHIHPYLSVPMVSLSLGCNCPDGKEKCVEMCNQKALTFVPREASTLKLTEEGDWFPSPLI
jgi:Fe-S-cluster-containing hydrogenase component 2